MRLLLFVLILLYNCTAWGQEKISGTIKSASGHAVEYATISVDSIFTLSDSNGKFSLFIPKSTKHNIHITHISYKPLVISQNATNNGNLNITLEEAINELSNITITNTNKKNSKLKAITGKGMRIPGGNVRFINEHNGTKEIGSIIKVNKDFVINNVTLKILSNSYTKCTLRIIIYRLEGKQVTPISTKPLYAEAKRSKDSYTLNFSINQQINLNKGHKYFIGLAIVDASEKGELNIPAHIHSGLGHNTLTGKTKKIPASIGLKIWGRYE